MTSTDMEDTRALSTRYRNLTSPSYTAAQVADYDQMRSDCRTLRSTVCIPEKSTVYIYHQWWSIVTRATAAVSPLRPQRHSRLTDRRSSQSWQQHPRRCLYLVQHLSAHPIHYTSPEWQCREAPSHVVNGRDGGMPPDTSARRPFALSARRSSLLEPRSCQMLTLDLCRPILFPLSPLLLSSTSTLSSPPTSPSTDLQARPSCLPPSFLSSSSPSPPSPPRRHPFPHPFTPPLNLVVTRMLRLALLSSFAVLSVHGLSSTSVFPNSACSGASQGVGLVGIGRVTLSNGEIETHCGCPSVRISLTLIFLSSATLPSSTPNLHSYAKRRSTRFTSIGRGHAFNDISLDAEC